MRRLWKNRQRAAQMGSYILMETCISIFFLSVGMTSIIRAMAHSLEGIRFSQNYLLSGYVLEEKIGEDILTGDVENGSDGIFFWEVQEKIDEEKELKEKTITINWVEKNRPNSHSFSYTLSYEK